MKKFLIIIFLAASVVALRAEPTGTNAVKISALSVASTPLSGTETVAVSQSAHGRQTTVNDVMLSARTLAANATNFLTLKATTNAAVAATGFVSNNAAMLATAASLTAFIGVPSPVVVSGATGNMTNFNGSYVLGGDPAYPDDYFKTGTTLYLSFSIGDNLWYMRSRYNEGEVDYIAPSVTGPWTVTIGDPPAPSSAFSQSTNILGSMSRLGSNDLTARMVGFGSIALFSASDFFAIGNGAGYQTAAQVATATAAFATSLGAAFATNSLRMLATNLIYLVRSYSNPSGVAITNATDANRGHAYYQLDFSAGSLQTIFIANNFNFEQQIWFRPTNFVAGQSISVLVINAQTSGSHYLLLQNPGYWKGTAYGGNFSQNFGANFRYDLVDTSFKAYSAGSTDFQRGKSALINFTSFGGNMTNIVCSVAQEL
jgi:hypothetical protein